MAELAQQFGNAVQALGEPEFFVRLVRAVRGMVPISNSDLVIIDLRSPLEIPPALVGVYCAHGRYAATIRERYLSCGYQLCPEIAAVRAGRSHGIFSMADLGVENFFDPACYDAYYGHLEVKNFYDLFAKLGDGRVAGWSIGRHLRDADFTEAEDHAIRLLAPLLLGMVKRHCELAYPPAAAVKTPQVGGFFRAIATLLDSVHAEPLTKRELQVAVLLARGLSSKAAARQLNIKPMTEAVHRKNIYRKLGMTSQVEFVSRCLGMLTNGDA